MELENGQICNDDAAEVDVLAGRDQMVTFAVPQRLLRNRRKANPIHEKGLNPSVSHPTPERRVTKLSILQSNSIQLRLSHKKFLIKFKVHRSIVHYRKSDKEDIIALVNIRFI